MINIQCNLLIIFLQIHYNHPIINISHKEYSKSGAGAASMYFFQNKLVRTFTDHTAQSWDREHLLKYAIVHSHAKSMCTELRCGFLKLSSIKNCPQIQGAEKQWGKVNVVSNIFLGWSVDICSTRLYFI